MLPQDMVPFKCNGKNCTLSFPLHEKTNQVYPKIKCHRTTILFDLICDFFQNSIQCPSENCGIETNIWQKRRRIVEIRSQYEALRGEIEKGKARQVSSYSKLFCKISTFSLSSRPSINFLHDLIFEWEKIVARPYKEFSYLEDILVKMLLLEHFEDEDKWIGFSSHWLRRAT